jgi:hypothetical protein
MVPVERIKLSQASAADKPPFVRIESITTEPNTCYNQIIPNKTTTVQVTVFSDNIAECEQLVDILLTGLFCEIKYINKRYDMLPEDSLFMYDSDTKYWLGIVRVGVWS